MCFADNARFIVFYLVMNRLKLSP